MHQTLAALQLGDGSLPTGRFAHSYGVESLLDHDPDADLASVIGTFATEQLAVLDGPAIAAVVRGMDPGWVDGAIAAARSDTRWARASQDCGAGLARVAAQIRDTPHAQAIRMGKARGEIASIHGDLARVLALDPALAVLIELRATVSAMLQAAVRLGALSSLAGQQLAARLRPDLREAVARALRASEFADPGPLPGYEHVSKRPPLFRS